MRGHLLCRDTFALAPRCPLIRGTTVPVLRHICGRSPGIVFHPPRVGWLGYGRDGMTQYKAFMSSLYVQDVTKESNEDTATVR